MRFLIVASILACTSAVPSLTPVLAPAAPTISAGDINGAAIDAHVEASDHFRAAVDATRQYQDKANELHGQAINNAQEHAWRVVDGVKTAEARLDGAAAAAAPILSKQIVGRVAPVSYAAPSVSYSAPAGAYSAPAVSYAAPAVPYSSHAVSYAAPAVSYAAPAVSYSAPAVSYSAPAVSYSAPVAAPVFDAPYSAYPINNVVSPYYGSPVEYSPVEYSHAW